MCNGNVHCYILQLERVGSTFSTSAMTEALWSLAKENDCCFIYNDGWGLWRQQHVSVSAHWPPGEQADLQHNKQSQLLTAANTVQLNVIVKGWKKTHWYYPVISANVCRCSQIPLRNVHPYYIWEKLPECLPLQTLQTVKRLQAMDNSSNICEY